MEHKKLNILFVISSLETISGPVKTLSLLAMSLKDRGHQVYVAFYEKATEVGIRDLKQKGVDVIDIASRQNSKWNRLQIIFRLRVLIKRFSVDVVHAHSFDADWYAVGACLFRQVKCIITIHSLSYFYWMQHHQNKYQFFILNRVDHFICVCHYLVENFQKRVGKCQDKLAVIHNTVPDTFFDSDDKFQRHPIRNRFRVSESEVLLGVIGNHSWVKGAGVFFESLKYLTQVNYKVLIIGHWPDDAIKKHQQYLKNYQLQDKVIFTGFQSDMAAMLSAIDLFVLPSVEEADPWVLVEAMAKAKAVVATSVGGIPEKVIDQKTGLLVPSRDPQALARAIDVCLRRTELLEAFGQEGKTSLQERFSFAQMIEAHERLYY